MTPLATELMAQIARNGPISIADYMAQALLHPTLGYYVTRDPLGVAGDFTTAPEISQMFGELIGLCLAQAWMDQGQPTPFTLAELGPGRGTMMADVLRATRAVPGFHAAARIVLVEASPVLRDRQRDALAGYDPSWLDTMDDLPDAPLYLIANEFFDALPIRQFQRGESGWRERQVGTAEEKLIFGLGPESPFPELNDRLADTKPGDLVETCAPATAITASVGRCIAKRGGLALIVDYGDWHSLGDTLQALRDHRPCDPLDAPGLTDLTAHVDFEPLFRAATAQGIQTSRLTPQGVFLERLGVTQRARKLAQTLGGAALNDHIAAHRRLTHPDEMGSLFKVLGLYPVGMPPPPGLEK